MGVLKTNQSAPFSLSVTILAVLIGWLMPLQAQADSLWVSNYPEEVSVPGMVQDRVVSAEGVRLLYFHKNIAKQHFRWGIWVQNVGTANATIQYFMGIGGPAVDGVFAGHIATREYMDTRLKRRVSEVTLAPGERVQLISQPMKPTMIVSGLMSLMATGSQSRFRVQMGIMDPDSPRISLLNQSQSKKIRTLEFEKMTDQRTVTFFTRDNAKIIPIGEAPYLRDRRTHAALQGNYGFVTDYTVQITNNLPVRTQFQIVFSSAGGVCRGVLVVNGNMLETGLFRPPDLAPQEMFRQELLPNQTATVTISIMPQPGSNYPASLVLKAEPIPQIKGGSV